MDPASPSSTAQAVVVLLTPIITEAVDHAILKGLEHLHKELQFETLRIGQAEEWISSMEDEAAATSAVIVRLSSLQKELQDKVEDLENHRSP